MMPSNTDPVYKGRTFVLGALRTPDIAYLLATEKMTAPNRSPATWVFERERGQWYEDARLSFDVVAVAICRRPLEQLAAVGARGECVFVGSGDIHVETIPVEKKMGPLRGAAFIGESLYVVGMQRRIYNRIAPARWRAIQGLPTPSQGEVCGFEAITGFSESELYAVGWNGEIFSFDGEKWQIRESPTNLVLKSACVTTSGEVFIAGQRGCVIAGRGDRWSVVSDGAVSDDLWSIVYFKDHIYVSSMSGVYVLDKGTLRQIELFKQLEPSTYMLTNIDELMWSVGNADVCEFDGIAWTLVAQS